MSKVNYKKSAKAEWNERTESIKPVEIDDVAFSELFEKYLPSSESLSCIEVGAIPGSFLVYFNKRFGYSITGIDFADNTDLFHRTMKKNGIKLYKFISGDFFKHKFITKFDVVTSFGFIEHFDDVDDVLRRHVELVKPGGYLVITLPNFRFLQHIYHYYFDKPNLDIHNLKAMRIGYLRRTLKRLGMKRLYADYYGNLSVWREETELSYKRLKQVHRVHRWVAKHGHKLPTTRIYSPYIVLIYKKPLNPRNGG